MSDMHSVGESSQNEDGRSATAQKVQSIKWQEKELFSFLPGKPERDDYHANLFIVLAHGFSGGPETTWDRFVGHAFYRDSETAPRPNVDILSYRWPAGLFERGSLTQQH